MLERMEVIGRGKNYRSSDGAIVVQAGWDVESVLEAAVVLRLAEKVKNVRIQAEFRGYCETKWDANGKLATQQASDDYKVYPQGRVFQQMVTVVYDSPDPIMPNVIGSANTFPFQFTLPKSLMPMSFESASGLIQYYIKVSILFQEGMKLLKSNHEMTVPVYVSMPEAAKIKMLSAPSQMFHQSPKESEKANYSLDIHRRILSIGESLEVNITIHSTPEFGGKLRFVNASLRAGVSYLNQSTGVATQGKFPRPLSEISLPFPNVRIGGQQGAAPIQRRVYLLVDPELAQASMESPFISVKTLFRLQIILDDSETPNVSHDVPVVVVPVTEQHARELQAIETKKQQEQAFVKYQQQQLQRPLPTNTPMYQPLVSRSDSLPSPSILMAPSQAQVNPRTSSVKSRKASVSRLDSSISAHRQHQQAEYSAYRDSVASSAVPALVSRQQSVVSNPVPGSGSVPAMANALNRNRSMPAKSPTHYPVRPHTGSSQEQLYQQQQQQTFSMLLNELEKMELSIAVSEQGSVAESPICPGTPKLEESMTPLPLPALNGSSHVANGNGTPGESTPTSEDSPAVPIPAYPSKVFESFGPMRGWSVGQVAEMVRKNGGSTEVVQSFVDNEIDGLVLLSLSEKDMKDELGIQEFSVRRRIGQMIQQQH